MPIELHTWILCGCKIRKEIIWRFHQSIIHWKKLCGRLFNTQELLIFVKTCKFRDAVLAEIESIRAKGHTSKSLHEGYALLLEEVEEFWAEVKKRKKNRDNKNMFKELVQIAALAEIISEDNVLSPH